MATDTKHVLYRILADALIELRVEGYAIDNRAVSALSDLFHSVPLRLEMMEQGRLSPEDIMREMEEHARRIGMVGWLTHRVEQAALQAPKTPTDKEPPHA